ncbi:MAG TPA: GntG family PLP-dependent aldolase [Gemmatimonadaceae bacterium]|nr:GntG family PLP-dependent aldolase [Gemmatimonadaceae bacterium]
MTIDLRSDTVTRPGAAMRAAIAAAEVGDDHLDGDPTTRRLEQRVAHLLGKEAALFFPTGTMANQAAVHVHTKPGTEILVDDDAHLINLTSAGVAALAGVQPRFIRATRRTFDAGDLRRAARAPSRFSPKPSLVSVENTHNGAGGSITSLADLRDIRSVASEIGVPLHLDGARLWNVEAATGVPVADYASCADTVMVSFSKGLGAPVGAALAGSAALMDAAWTARKRLGGALRQSGIIAAGALFGVENNRDRLVDDHANATRFAAGVGDAGGASVVPPDTNIVMIDLPATVQAPDVAKRLAARGLLVSVWTPSRLRVVTHLDVSTAEIDEAAATMREVLERG